jgi:Tol biopolymer transport system component
MRRPGRVAWAIAALVAIGGAAAAQESAPSSAPASRPANPGDIAFTRGGNVWVIDADGRNERQLTTDLQYDRPIGWMADGRRVVFWKHHEDWHLWTIDAVSGAAKDLTPDGGDCRSATASPDGTLVAFMSGRDGLSLVGADGSNRRILAKLGHRDAPPAWSPDGTRLAFVDLRSTGERQVDIDIHLIGKDGAGSALLVGSADEPAWSRDGRTLYCIARRGSGPDLCAIDLATRTEKNLTSTRETSETSPVVSPDGRTIAFVAWDAEWKSAELRLIDADGSRPRTLARLEGRPALPSWSPDSGRIAITSGPDRNEDLLVIDAASGQSTRLTTKGASSSAWRPR